MKRFLPVLSVCIMVLCTGFTNKNCSFAGKWNTNWGQLTLKATGDDYTGDYSYNGIKGTVTGKLSIPPGSSIQVILKGRWKQGTMSGRFELKRWCLENKFTGEWYNDNGRESGDWDGAKLY